MIEQISLVFFGLTGQGKSSIANMMIQGDIYQKGNVFEINDGAVGASVSINFSENEYFKVFDTIGVGETNSGSVPHKEAVKEIRNYFTTCKVPLNYIVYVKKKGRFTEEDRTMFNLFKEIFEGCEKNFIIIITNCDERWIEKNKETLIKNFGEDYPTIPVDFPWDEDEDDDDDSDYADIQQYKRIQSLLCLIEKLTKLNYEITVLQVLSSFQSAENKVSKVIDLIPIAGSAYHLISSGVYYKLGKSNVAKERLINGVTGAVMDVSCVGAFRAGLVAGKLTGKAAFKAMAKGAAKSTVQGVAKEGVRYIWKKLI